jgi:hypothetical protein
MSLSEHQSVALASTDPKGVGSVSPDPLGTSLATSDPTGKGSTLSDPRGVRSVPPNSLERIPPRPIQGLQSQLMLGRGRTRLDVTGGLHRLYLGTHVPNSAR